MLVAIVGGILLVAAVLVSSISTMRLKPKANLSADGVKEAQYEPQNEFRNTSGFTYREKMKKDLAGVLPVSWLLPPW